MPVDWKPNSDAVFAEAKASGRPVLIDFTAAPACVVSARLDSESYTNAELSAFIYRHFVPLRICITAHPEDFDRFDVVLTPTVLILDSAGKERYRIEGYLPLREFGAHLVLGLGRIALTRKRWQEAEDFYAKVLEEYPDTKAVAEALFWSGVCCYKQTHDMRVLAEMSPFNPRYEDTIWAIKASVWGRSK